MSILNTELFGVFLFLMYEGRQQKFNFSHRAVVLTVAASGVTSHMTCLKDFSTSAMIPLLEG